MQLPGNYDFVVMTVQLILQCLFSFYSETYPVLELPNKTQEFNFLSDFWEGLEVRHNYMESSHLRQSVQSFWSGTDLGIWTSLYDQWSGAGEAKYWGKMVWEFQWCKKVHDLKVVQKQGAGLFFVELFVLTPCSQKLEADWRVVCIKSMMLELQGAFATSKVESLRLGRPK